MDIFIHFVDYALDYIVAFGSVEIGHILIAIQT